VIYRLLGLIALLALLAAVLVLSGPQRSPALPTAAEGGASHGPGYSALDAQLVQTGPDGRPLYTLDAAQIHEQPGSNVVQLDQVQMGFRDSSGQQWTARAQHGVLGQDTGVVQLDGDVHVAGTLPHSQDPVEISTQHLAFDTRAQLVSTRDPVTFAVAGHRLDGTGLMVSLKDHRVQLESGVHGTFPP
jgi:lipopolysaccharide export system protein LptC